MTQRARLNDLISLAALLAAAAFLVADEKPAMLPFALIIIGVSWFGSRPRASAQAWVLPRSAIGLLVLAAILNAAARALAAGGDPPVSVLGQFLVLVTLVKLFDRRSSRDDAQALTLTICSAIAALLTGASLAMALIVVVYIPCALAAAMIWQLVGGHERASRIARFTVGASVAPPAPLTRTSRFAGHLASSVVLSAIVCSAVATGVFVVAPRGLRVGQSVGFGFQHATTEGFTDQIQLGRAGLISDNTTPVLDVEITDASGENIGSESRTYYLRAATRTHYDPASRAWSSPTGGPRARRSPPPGERIDRRPGEPFPVLSPDAAQAATTDPARIIQRFNIRHAYADKPCYLFTVWRPLGVVLNQNARVDTHFHDCSMTIASPRSEPRRADPFPLGYRYSIVSLPGDAVEDREPGFALGFQQGAIADFARTILRSINIDSSTLDPETTRHAAQAFTTYLRRNYDYDLTLIPPRAGRDPIEHFLLDARRGHCEYFASSLVALCQSVGIHARLIAGYVAADFNDLTGRYIVRESHAHAWAEVHLGDGRWITLDPTPPEDLTRLHRPRAGLLAQLKRWWDALDYSWSGNVVAFDTAAQDRLLGRDPTGGPAGVRPGTFGERLGNVFRSATGAGDPGARWLTQFTALLLIAAVIIGVRAVMRHLRKRRLLRPAHADPELRRLLHDAGFYADALIALDRAGLAKPHTRPPLAHAALIAPARADLAARFRAITDLYYRLRFGRTPLAPDELSHARRLADLLRSQRRPTAP